MGILSGIGRWLGSRTPLDAVLCRAIERAVEIVDPQLKGVSGYQRKLALAARCALDHCAALAGQIPGPIDVNLRSFATDPLVHAIFAAPDDIGDMLGKSRELREFVADPGQCGAEGLFALLGMRQREKAVTGIAMNGEALQRDVPQRLLYFADHTLGEFGGSHEACRQHLAASAFDGLAKGFAARVTELRQQRDDARTAWSIERACRDEGRGEHRQMLEDRQRQAIASLAPERLLDAFAEWLAQSQMQLCLRPKVVRVDRMGVIAGEHGTEEDFTALSFPELVSRDRRQWVVLIARISREDALEALRRRQEANRYLMI